MPDRGSDMALRFEMPAHIMGDALILTTKFCDEASKIGGGTEQKFVSLADESGNNHPCVLHVSLRHFVGIEAWRRQVKPGLGDKVVLEATPE
jgi:hypothetical protein